MLSYWERETLLVSDYLVIGGGITGLSTAASLCELEPGASVTVLERGALPSGASTKNAGFACVGSLTELLDDLRHMSVGDMLQLVEMRKSGLQKLRNRLGDKNIGYAENGSHELLSEKELPCLEKLDYLNGLLQPIFGRAAFGLANQNIARFGFNPDVAKALVSNNCEGELDTGKMMRSLWKYATEKGARVVTGANVIAFETTSKGVEVQVESSTTQASLGFRARKLAICTNAFAKDLLPHIDLKPGRGQVLVTKPIPNLRLKGVFHSDRGYWYFRSIGQRVLIGGGRHLDFGGETSIRLETNRQIVDAIHQQLQTLVLPGIPYQTDMQWAGIMAFGSSKQPLLERLGEHVCVGVRLGGMGVAIGSQIGQALACMMLE